MASVVVCRFRCARRARVGGVGGARGGGIRSGVLRARFVVSARRRAAAGCLPQDRAPRNLLILCRFLGPSFGNAPEGNRPASTAPVPPPPRALRGPLLALLLDDGLQSCIPVQELAKVTNVPTTTLAEQIDVFRSKVQTAFRVNHPWKVENVQDGYYFDLTCYALWRTAAAAIPKDYSQRDIFQRNVGRQLLNEIIGRDIAQKTTIDVLDGSNAKALALTDSVPCIIDILDLFQSANYCTSYRLGDKNDGERTGRHVFDRFDDEELSSGGSVDCLVSVLDPATLGGALQITGEGSRFAPDFLGPTLAAVWERAGGPGVVVSFESYFVDPVYRPNPKVRNMYHVSRIPVLGTIQPSFELTIMLLSTIGFLPQ